MPEACDFFNGWWRDSFSLIVYHDSHFVYWFGWFKYISMHVWWMVPTAEQISGAWRSRLLRPQTSQYVGCRPYCWSYPRSLMKIAALVRNKIISSCNCVLLKDCWIWWLVLVAEDSMDDCPRESRLASKLPASVRKTPKMDSLSFSICLRSFIPDKSFYLAAGMDRIN